MPMFSDAISGLKVAAGRTRCSMVMVGGAARGDVDDAIGALLDDFEERREGFRGLVGTTVFGIARMQVHDGRARFGGTNGRLGNLLALIGKYGDMEGVWIEPVTAQVMMTLREDGLLVLSVIGFILRYHGVPCAYVP